MSMVLCFVLSISRVITCRVIASSFLCLYGRNSRMSFKPCHVPPRQQRSQNPTQFVVSPASGRRRPASSHHAMALLKSALLSCMWSDPSLVCVVSGPHGPRSRRPTVRHSRPSLHFPSSRPFCPRSWSGRPHHKSFVPPSSFSRPHNPNRGHFFAVVLSLP